MDRHSRLNRIFRGIKQRCFNINNSAYKDYGGRGITLCPEWNNRERVKMGKSHSSKGFLAFTEWALSNGYQESLTIDRIDNNKGYSPDNCRWISMKGQCDNRRSNHLVTYKGVTKTLKQWSKDLGLNYYTVWKRVKRFHWSLEKAFEKSTKVSEN